MQADSQPVSPPIKRGRGGFRPGAGRPKGIRARQRNEGWLSTVTRIKKQLVEHGFGNVDMNPSQVKALEVILDRHEPRLSSVEQVQQDPRDLGDPNALLSQMVAALAANPLLVARLRQALEQAEQQAAELAGVAIANASAITQQSEGESGNAHGSGVMSKANAKSE